MIAAAVETSDLLALLFIASAGVFLACWIIAAIAFWSPLWRGNPRKELAPKEDKTNEPEQPDKM